MIAWIDGRVVPAAAARVPLLDRAHLFGEGVFETVLVRNGRLFRAADHLDRLGEGLRALGLTGRPIEAATDALEALAAAVSGDHLVRVQVTTGETVGVDATPAPRVTAFARPLPARPDAVTLVTARHVKRSDDPLCGVKHTSFLPHLLARRAARAAGADDALLRNEHLRAAEATTSNVMALVDGAVHAPGRPEGALDGVTRQVVLEALGDAGTPVEGSLDRAQLEAATEVWLTNTSGGCTAVTALDGRPVGGGRRGPTTARLHALVLSAIERETGA